VAFQQPSTEVWEMLAATAEQCQKKFNDALLLMKRKAKEEANNTAEEALALLKAR
jgi:hypothetical protein